LRRGFSSSVVVAADIKFDALDFHADFIITDTHYYSNHNADTDSYTNTYTDSYAYTDSYSDANTNANANPDTNECAADSSF